MASPYNANIANQVSNTAESSTNVPSHSHVRQHSSYGEPTVRSATTGDDLQRARPGTFGLKNLNCLNTESETAVPVQPDIPAQPILAQHSGFFGQQQSPTSSQAGPPNLPSPSRTQHRPISSVLHETDPTQRMSTAATNRPMTATRSPFSSPITSPPRGRPNQILLINPTSTIALSNLLLNTLRPNLPHGLEVTVYNAPYPSPTAIESTTDSVLSCETVLRDLAKYSTNNGETVQNYDALLVASYSKHPLIDALRESYDVPVIGIMEASLYIARMLGDRFGIISTSTRMKYQIEDAVSAYELTRFYVGAESLHINPLDLLVLPASTSRTSSPVSGDYSTSSTPSNSSTSRSKAELHQRLTVQARSLVAKGADTIILGSEFLSSPEAARVVKDAIREDDGRRTVNVIDAIEAGVMTLNGLVGMGVPTSKKGVYRGEREGRRGRGQNWL